MNESNYLLKTTFTLSILGPEILKFISMWDRDAFYIIESRGKIINANSYGVELLKTEAGSENLLDYFESESSKKFEQLIEEAVEKYSFFKYENLKLKLKDGRTLRADMVLNPVTDKGNILILCAITPRLFNFNLTAESRIKTGTVLIEELVKTQELNEILNKLINLYPLTFIGKEIIHRLVNQLDEFFWLKDDKGNYLIVNNSYAASLGLKPGQLEGKPYQNFIPVFLVHFYNALNTFMKETLNYVIMDGAPFLYLNPGGEKELIEFPFTDNDGKVVALVGFSRVKTQKTSDVQPQKRNNDIVHLIDNFPEPVGLINSEGRFENANKEFSKLFAQKFNQLQNVDFKEVFNHELSDRIIEFINSASNGIVIDINESLELIKSNESDYKLYLTKYYRKENQFAGISIYLQKNKYFESLQQLIKSKGRMFEILIKNNPSPIFIYDKENLSFLEVNDAALRLYGYTRDEFLQMDLTDLYSPEDIQTLLGTSDQVYDNDAFSRPFRHRKKDGKSVLVEINKISFKYNDRDSEFNIISDITGKIEQDKKIQLFKTVFDNTSNVIFLTDPEGIITFANSAAENILKVSRKELEKTTLTSHCVDEDRVLLNTSIFQSHLKDTVTVSVKLKDANDNPLEADLIATPIIDFDSEVESYSIIVIPKILVEGVPSEPKEIIKEVIREIIVEKPVESNQLITKQLDSNFLSGVFHEILTPMNVILGFAQELTEGSENMTQEQKEAAEIINQNRFTLLSTMNSIIEFSDIHLKKTKLDITEVGITEIIELIDNNIKDITGSRKIDFAYGKISSSLRFRTDKKVFESFINNLVRLVNKITSENKVYFSAYPHTADQFLISVSDKYGNTSESLENTLIKLFIDGRDPKELGVSKLTNQITKSLLNALQGKLITFKNENNRNECGFLFPMNLEKESVAEIESTADVETFSIKTEEQYHQEDFKSAQDEIELDLDQPVEELPVPGSQASFIQPGNNSHDISGKDTVEEVVEEEISEPVYEEMPIEPEEQVHEIEVQMDEPEVESKVQVKSKPKPMKVLNLSELKCLYIEDQVDSQILFKVQMKGLKDIQFAASFEEALPLLDSHKFDFIVMDINLQGEYNGLDALKIIHKMPGLETIPIVAVTAYVLPGDKEKFIATGFNDFISKPIFREKMVESLNKIFVN